MSMLINIIGFSISASVRPKTLAIALMAVFGGYPEEDYTGEVSPEPRNINADILGLGVEMVGHGLESVDRKTDFIFDNPVSKWLSWKIIDPFQLQPDGHYFKSRADIAWEGYETEEDVPVFRTGKFEMLI